MGAISEADLDKLVREKVGHLLPYPIVGWDLDSTVCGTLHRRFMVPAIKAGEATWDDYAMMCDGDEPIAGSLALMKLMSKGPDGLSLVHVAISGRSGLAEDKTTDWAIRHGVPLDAAILRPEGDHTQNGEWKVRVIKAIRRLGGHVRLFMEDWDEAAAYIVQHAGVPVVGINPFYPPEAEKGGAV